MLASRFRAIELQEASIERGIVLLRVGVFAGYLYGVNQSTRETTTILSTLTTTFTAVSTESAPQDEYEQVADAYVDHILMLDGRNVSALMSGYEDNATIMWKGLSGGCDGNYSGSSAILALLGMMLTNEQYFLVSNETQVLQAVGNNWLVSSTFSFSGDSTGNHSVDIPFVSSYEGTVSAQDSYVKAGKTWSIASETWDFLYYDQSVVEQPIHTSPF
jgi:hypothetical protein